MQGGAQDEVLVVLSDAEERLAVTQALAPSYVATEVSAVDAARLLTSKRFLALIVEEPADPQGGPELLVRAAAVAPNVLRVALVSEAGDLVDSIIEQAEPCAVLFRPVRPGELRAALMIAQRQQKASRARDTGVRELAARQRELLDEKHTLTLALEDKASTIARLSKQLERLSARDPVTGAYTEPYLQERADQEVKRARRYNAPLSLVICDIDGFRALGERYGRARAAAALAEVARLLIGRAGGVQGSSRLRDTDVVARYGADALAILLPTTPREGALVVAERIRIAVAQHAFEALGDGTIRLTVSLGVASFPLDAASRGELLERADQALYRAKMHGTNSVAKFGAAGAETTRVPR
jgi:diguanylate cyclase (GGDEF)-like protein